VQARKHYAEHKERARTLIQERLTFWNQIYTLSYGRVTIRNQQTRWGSCSTRGNLNFNYKIVFLPIELVDYIVVHELCHLIEFNHSQTFWGHVARVVPDYRERKHALRILSQSGAMYREVPRVQKEFASV